MKYSPGFDDPPTRPKVFKFRVIAVAVTLLTAVVLGALLAYLSPTLMVEMGNLLQMFAGMLGLH